jgi:hypothetical protein
MRLAGHLADADGERVTFADDLPTSLDNADRYFDERFRGVIDRYIERAAIDAMARAAERVSHRSSPPRPS